MFRPTLASALVLALLAVAAIGDRAPAQCTTVWRAGGTPGTNGIVNASIWWDADGAGPAAPVWVVGGNFQFAGDQMASNIAAYDPAAGTWSALGVLPGYRVTALAIDTNGALIAAASFGQGGGSLARWTGSAWTAFAPGLIPVSTHHLSSGDVRTLAVLPNGDVVAGGHFRVSGVAGAQYIARWDGASWTPFGGSAEAVGALLVRANGELLIGNPAGAARWTGTAWSSLGASVNGGVEALAELPNGDVIAGGGFSGIGGVVADNIARWNGTSWSPLGASVNFRVNAIAPLAAGGFAAGGVFSSAGGVPASKVARWNGSQWSNYGAGLGNPLMVGEAVNTLVELPNGHLAAGGNFTTSGGTPVGRVAIWNGGSWLPLGGGFVVLPGARVLATAVAPNGDLIAGGSFVAGSAPVANSIARWNGSAWSGLGSGFPYDDGNPPVYAVAVMPNGDVIAGGQFTAAGGVPASNIARWDGTTWSPLGPGSPARVTSLLVLPTGELLAAGDHHSILRWNGTAWSAFGTGFNGTITTLVRLDNGDLIAGGYFAGCIRRFDGTTWSALGGGIAATGVNAVVPMPNGDLVVGGWFTSVGGIAVSNIARWNGSTWAPLGAGTTSPLTSLAVLPNGELAAGGVLLAGGVFVDGVARWNGTSWAPLGPVPGPGGGVSCLRLLDEGQLLVGGGFPGLGGGPSPYLVRLDTTCPASASASGTGCPGSGGTNTLAAATLPWIGSTFVATGTGLPAPAFVVAVTGFTPLPQGAAPLSLVFPQAGAGCDVLAFPDILGLSISTTGTTQSSIVLPNAPSLVGAPFYHQLVPIEVDPQLTFVAVTATNALRVTPGSF